MSDNNNTYNVSSNNQTGGITAGQVNVNTQPPGRKMDDTLKGSLESQLPKGKPIAVFGQNGNTESMTFAREIYDFLRDSGFTLVYDEVSAHQFFNIKPFQVNVSEGENGAQTHITIGNYS